MIIDYAAAIILNLSALWIAGLRLYRRFHDRTEILIRPPLWIMGFMAFGLVFDLYMVLRAPFPQLDWLVIARPAILGWAGIALMAGGTAFFCLAQLNMGTSWRIGVPDGDNDIEQLQTDGLYRLSRNPVYLGILIMLTGCVLVAPGPVSVLVLVVSWLGITKIIRQEEAYLNGQFGEAYRTYRQRVGRWFK